MEEKVPLPTTTRAPTSNKPTSSGIGNQKNPFYGGGHDNFPSLERALGTPGGHQHKCCEHGSSCGSRTDSLDLSIDARAALHEHLRQVNKFGMDGEFAEQRGTSNGEVPPTALPSNTLDEEWENILQGNSVDFHHSLNDSSLPTFDRLQVLNANTTENDIEVAVVEMTCIEADVDDDYFNSSKVWQLMTPEKNRGRNPRAVTNRNQDVSYDDDYDDDEQNSPERSCVVETTPHPDFLKQDKVSPLSSSNESSQPSPRPSNSTPPKTCHSPLEGLSPLAAAAAAIAQNLERNPSRVASVALADFLNDDSGVQNSLLMTSVHEDLPLITSPFAPAPDMEGSFADWSVHSVENPSFVLSSAMTPIRQLPPLSPIPSVRGSPSNCRRGSGSGNWSNPSRGSPRSSASSSSYGRGSWRLSMEASPPRRGDLDFALREEVISPIRPIKLAPTHEEEEEKAAAAAAAVKQEFVPGNSTTPLSSLAKQAAQTAEQFLQGRRKSPLQPPNKWPSLGSVDSFESSSTAGMADVKFQQNIHCDTVIKTASHDPHRDGMTAPVVSLDTLSSTDNSGFRSTRSADHNLIDRRRFRTVVPRRIVFPHDSDDHEHHADSFDRPCQSF